MKLSIITVNRNNSRGLERTLQSVFSQTYKDFEEIVIDGGSIDLSVSVISKYKNGISYWISERDSGIYNAMNKGIRAAKGEYLLFMNSGDTFVDSNSLSLVLNNKFSSDYIFCERYSALGNKLIKHSVPEKLTFYYLYNDCLHHQAMFIKKNIFEKYGYYDENLTIVSDWKQYIVGVFFYNCTFTLLHQVIAINEELGASSMKNINKLMEERQLVLMSYFPGFCEDYKEYHQMKRLTMTGIIRGLKRRYREWILK